jgi:hypothetical protein
MSRHEKLLTAVRLLDSGPLTSADWLRRSGLPKATFYRARADALARGFVELRGDRYFRGPTSLDEAPPAVVPRRPVTLRQARAAAVAAIVARYDTIALRDLLDTVRASDQPLAEWTRYEALAAVEEALRARRITVVPGEAASSDIILTVPKETGCGA